MSAQSVASRSRRPHRPENDDPMLARALEFSNWARNNVRIIVITSVIAVIVVAGLLYYRTYQADRESRAASQFMQLEATVSSGNATLAARDLEQFATRYDGTTYASEARLLLARVRLQEGNPAEALTALQPVSDVGSLLGAQAALLRAAAQQSAGQSDAAIATYLEVAADAPAGYIQQDALASAAALRAQASDFAGAAELYRRLVEMAEDGSVQRTVFEMRLAEAEAQAGGR